MTEHSTMDTSMTKNVKDIIAGAFQYKSTYKDRTNYISNRLAESYPSLKWVVSVYEELHGHMDCSKAPSNYYYYHCLIDGSFVIILGYQN